MSNVGMDIAAVRQLAKLMACRADEIESIANDLTRQLGHVDWRGTDADRFRSDWNGNHRSQLQRVATILRDTSSAATHNANDQEQASSR